MNVLVCPDKFKGTLSAPAAAQAITRGWLRARPADLVHAVPMTDGGDGFESVIRALAGGERRETIALDAAHDARSVAWTLVPGKLAVVESAAVIGLAMLPQGKFHPRSLDTRGLGIVLREVSRFQVPRCFVGLGGSATNDGGFGMARELGWQFLDASGNEILHWYELTHLVEVITPADPLKLGDLAAVVDVMNPLLGERGATRVYGPQKGLRPEDLPTAEAALAKLAEVMASYHQKAIHELPGTGAAGGLGFAMEAFLGARISGGFGLFSELAHLEEQVDWADVVVTGEGAMDASSLMGKGVGQLIQMAAQKQKLCLGLAGGVDPELARQSPIPQFKVRPLTSITTLENAKARADVYLEALAAEMAAGLEPGG